MTIFHQLEVRLTHEILKFRFQVKPRNLGIIPNFNLTNLPLIRKEAPTYESAESTDQGPEHINHITVPT